MNGVRQRLAWTAAALLGVAVLAVAADNADRPAPKNSAVLSQLIDQEINRRLAAEGVKLSPRADDAEFLRRVYLDLTGVIPPADKVAAFLDSAAPDKRAELIDELLTSPQYGRHLADLWQDLLLPRVSDNRRLQTEPFVTWLQERFNKNMPWDKLVTELLTSSGKQDENGAVTFFLANPTPDKMTDAVCRLFLGVQLQCAQCHNHPFTKWKQDEYWAMAAFFSRVRPDNVKAAAKRGNTPGINEDGRGRVRNLPESYKNVPAQFFQGDKAKLKSSESYRAALAKWLTAPGNPFFARAAVNRTWAQFFGRGFVNPIDDIHDGHPASHPELFNALAAAFAASGFDLKDLTRAICNSETYQRTSKPFAGNDDVALFSHVAVKALTAEQMYDSLTAILGAGGREGRRRPVAAMKGGPRGDREQFIAFFQTEENADPTEYQGGIPQALRLMNSEKMNNAAALAPLLKSGTAPAQVVEKLYLTVLARRPTTEESRRMADYVAKNGGAKAVYGDILWALLNSSEFALNH